ncbi:inhibitor of growth protein 2-like [Helicoverpa armigera]|uniref:inhibitor of growth protein 2-like n=2 Tax=Helicoverpa TaxID=7112 RepID=UPI003083024B
MDNIYGSEENIEDSDDFSSDDNVPLANLKDNKFRSPFQELLPTPNYAVTKNKPRRKAINYKGQRVTKDLFKEQETLKENKLTKKRKPKESKKTKNEKKKRSKGDKRKRSNLSVEESWFCPACNENRVSDMRQCVKCRIWYHEECLGLTKNDKDFFYCQNCDE